MDNPAAWHPDPTGRHQLRYWDGQDWTEHVSDQGVQAIDADLTKKAHSTQLMTLFHLVIATIPRKFNSKSAIFQQRILVPEAGLFSPNPFWSSIKK